MKMPITSSIFIFLWSVPFLVVAISVNEETKKRTPKTISGKETVIDCRMTDKSEVISQFIELTQVPSSVAEVLLERNHYDVQLALDDFYNGGTQQQNIPSSSSEQNQGPFEAHSTSSSSSNSRQGSAAPKSSTATGKPSRFKSFQQLIGGSNDSDDDQQNFFAGGGEGSGINVENPNAPRNLVQDLLRKAEQGGGHPDRVNDNNSSSSAREPRFDGIGYKLGDSMTESTQVGSRSYAPKKLEKAIREITFWKEGFQVGDGPLYRYDDPANSTYLAELNSGRAPVSLLNVEYGQDVDVNVTKKLDEEFKPPKRKIGGFHGQGQRLGSPVSPEYVAPSTTIDEPVNHEEEEPKEEEEKGDATVQIRLADGRRIVKKFQSAAPVQTIYSFVQEETSKTTSREFTLNHAFPVKVIDDLQQSIKEAGLINSVVVQRWV